MEKEEWREQEVEKNVGVSAFRPPYSYFLKSSFAF